MGAVYHFSEEPGIAEFRPRPPIARPEAEPLVWAVAGTHQAPYLFPRDCPRILAWPLPTTTDEDRRTWLGDGPGRTVACIEWAWFERLREAVLYRYALPAAAFAPLDGEDEPWMLVSREPVVPERVEVIPDLLAALRDAGVELRVLPSLVPLKNAWETTMHVSGIRLRNAAGWA